MKLKSELCTESLIFKEPSLKHYKLLLKSIYGETPNQETFVETVIDIATEITDKPSYYFRNLNTIDFFLFLLDLRMLILGQDCSIIIKQNEKDMKLSLNLDLMKEQIISTFRPIIETELRVNNNDKITINVSCPSFSRLLKASEFDEYIMFIKRVALKTEDRVLSLDNLTNKQAEDTFNKLLPGLSVQIIDYYKSFVSTCGELNLLEPYKVPSNQKLTFFPSTQTIIWLCQLIFNESLSNIYDNLFYLSYYGRLDLTYIENGTVGEYVYFTNMLRSTLNSKNGTPSQQEIPFTDDDALTKDA